MKQQTIEEIRDGLRNYYGALKRVVEATETLREGGYSRRHVQRVLNGQWKNPAILSIAAKELARCRAEEDRAQRKIESILQRAQATA